MADPMRVGQVNREALVILTTALSGEPTPEWRSPLSGFTELPTSGPDDQVFVGLFVQTDFLEMPLSEVSRQIAPAIIELARRLKATGREPSTRSLELPERVYAAWNQYRGIAMRAVIMDYPAPTREIAQDFGGRLTDWYNTDLDCLEWRCCVKVVRFDVPLEDNHG